MHSIIITRTKGDTLLHEVNDSVKEGIPHLDHNAIKGGGDPGSQLANTRK